MTESLNRIIKRDKPKAEIVESMTRQFFKNSSGDEAVISIKPNNMTRTQKQNALYWSIVEQIKTETGNTKDAIHVHCQSEFLETRVEEVAKQHDVIAWAENDLGMRLNLPDDWRELIS